MPKNKDLKRKIRARMAKTGERYTTARAHLLGRPEPTALPDDHEALAGQTDATVAKATGRDWAAWVALLDESGATELGHTEIAKLAAEHVDNLWWAQTVAVGYGRLLGKREPGMGCDGDYKASKSKTLPADAPTVHAALVALAEDDAWRGTLAFTGATEPKSVRFAGADGSRAALWIAPKGPDKCSVSVDHGKLPDAEARDAAKDAWAERLQALANSLPS